MLVHYVTCLCEESLFVYIKINKIDVKIVDTLVLLLQQRVCFVASVGRYTVMALVLSSYVGFSVPAVWVMFPHM